MTHTATPWEAKVHTLFNGEEIMAGVKDAEGETIRVTGFALSGGVVAEANSKFIVLACNAHDDLVAMLQEIVSADDAALAELAAMGAPATLGVSALTEKARALLAKVAA